MDNSATSKNQQRSSASAPLPAVLQSVKHDTRNLLAERLEALFHSADDALFEMADRAASDLDQNLFFDSMRIVRLQRASIQQKYIDAYSRSWTAVMNGRPATVEKPAPVPVESDDFSLVANEELEISVAAAGICSKVAARFQLPISQLTARLEDVCGRELGSELNPLGPESLNQNFIRAIDTLDVDIKVRLILLKLFERFVAEELAPVYERANTVLIDAGVLPKLRHRISSARSTGKNSTDHSNAPEQVVIDEATPTPTTEATSAAPPEFIQLQSLLSQARDNGVGSYAAADHGAATLISTPQLLKVLGVVQGDASEEPINLAAPAAPIDFRAVLAEAGGTSASAKPKLEQQSDDVVDLVKMLFDYILNDRNLAIPMKALIGRLQIPILKVAILDQSFFAKPSHPYNKIESIVLRVMNGFTEDLTLFSNLIAELRHFIQKDKKKRNQVEQRVRETEAGKAKTREARKTVQTLINQKACGLQLPAAAGRFVSDTWSRVLVYLFVTKGTEHDDWAEALQTLDDLLWAAQPLSNEWELSRRDGLLPILLTQLESGITLANLPEAEGQLERLRNAIEEIHTTDLDQLESQSRSTPRAELEEQGEVQLVTAEDTAPEELENLADPQFIEKILLVSEGQWVELRDNSNTLIRCKLATIVQPGNRYVFVNRKGMKVCERSRNALALALQSDELNLLDETQMFDRALEAVVGNLQQMQDARAIAGT